MPAGQSSLATVLAALPDLSQASTHHRCSEGLHLSLAAAKLWPQSTRKSGKSTTLNCLSFTYIELDYWTTEVAKAFINLGLEKGDRVGVFSPNCVEWTLAQYACARAGLILVSVNPSFTTDELVYCLNKVQCKALIMADQHKRQNYLNVVK